MNRFSAIVLVAGLAGSLSFATSLGAQPHRAVTIAAGSVDGVYYPIAGAVSRITSEARDLNIRATVQSSAGSVANAQLIRWGEADFALLQNDIAYYVFNGSNSVRSSASGCGTWPASSPCTRSWCTSW